jgi:hypothetical protein
MEKEIRIIPRKLAVEWCLKKHYAKRKPRIQYAFGLFIKQQLEGIITYGLPATPFVARGICGNEFENEVIELNRLVINANTQKNSASFLISNSIKLLPKKYKIIISFADTAWNHKGYVYQATNFIYTGLTINMKEWNKKGCNKHSQNICKELSLKERIDNPSYYQIQRPKKHRYLFFRGTKSEKKLRKKNLKYKQEPYPKGKTERYDCIDINDKQRMLNSFFETQCNPNTQES